MKNKNKNNSIIFLTTLSVYLGLVLVGAPATVLAQAALTSRFEVKEKIERKDDLDKKPDEFADEKIQSLKFGNQVILDYVEVVKILLEASRKRERYFYQTLSFTCFLIRICSLRRAVRLFGFFRFFFLRFGFLQFLFYHFLSSRLVNVKV